MATLDALVEELERSYAELQERMADPAVYSDHREAADLGRRLKELEPAVKLAREWQQALGRSRGREGRPGAGLARRRAPRADVERLEDELKLALVERDPADART